MPSEQGKRERRKPKKYWVFGVYLDPPYFYIFLFGIVMFVVFLLLAILFSPPEPDLINVFLSMGGLLISVITLLSGITKNYFDASMDGLSLMFERGFKGFGSRVNEGFIDLGFKMDHGFKEMDQRLDSGFKDMGRRFDDVGQKFDALVKLLEEIRDELRARRA